MTQFITNFIAYYYWNYFFNLYLIIVINFNLNQGLQFIILLNKLIHLFYII